MTSADTNPKHMYPVADSDPRTSTLYPWRSLVCDVDIYRMFIRLSLSDSLSIGHGASIDAKRYLV